MSNEVGPPSEAEIWKGTGEEYEGEAEVTKLFIDGAKLTDIRSAVRQNPGVEELHFAHDINWMAVEWFVEKLPITVEVDRLAEVPNDFGGRITIMLRVPSTVDMVKQRDGKSITVVNVEWGEDTKWDGRKVYEEDTVLKWKEQ